MMKQFNIMVRYKDTISPQVTHVLQFLYMNPTKYGGFLSSAETLFKTLKRMYPALHITKNMIQSFLNSQPTYTRNRQFRHHFKTRRIILGGLKQLHQADLIDMQQYS